ncbi:hypothetical protein [Methylobacterium sp. 13MFTsu3.1M2]|uniref:hypothetical protein n=1 Tax=Methylobacterium sp. 13MFTsu3.1M2 TaxID=1502776 RepID=UPI0008F20F48|nr:hypothetical protein [Methylobacterium sp. 13MFTsu3.1M2]SFE88079.1 hypothetical protein SAMN02799627_04600 [Methylobacterium sp. 13MFTsu3.1M2]
MTTKKGAAAPKKVADKDTARGSGRGGRKTGGLAKPRRRLKAAPDWGADPDPGYRPPSGITEPAADPSIPPKNARLLPLHEVGSRRFEELCLEILKDAHPDIVVRSSLKRTSGVEQFGVDCEGFDADHEPAVVVSCKCYLKVNAWDIRIWVDEFLKHIDGHWSGKKVRIFILAVTHEFNDDNLNDATRKLVARLRQRGIDFKLWNADLVTGLVARDANKVARYFHEAWVEVLARNAGQSVSTVAGSAQFGGADMRRLMEQALDQFAAAGTRQLGPALGGRLTEAVAAVRRGRPSELLRWYEETRGDDTAWRTLRPEVQAEALRAVAVLHIQDGETGPAGPLLDEADSLNPASDPVERALLQRSIGPIGDALALLPNPSTTRGKELKVALLIEAGAIDEAHALAALPGSESTEQLLRLRAMIAFLNGNRELALREARSAVGRAPHDFLPRLTRGMIRLNAAMAEGVTPQFGRVPQPINVGLVRDDPAARTLLDGAVADFEAVAGALETSASHGVEVWQLAALLLHPDRREEGVRLARRLLSREPLEPMAVAWANNCNVPRRSGHLRKRLGDVIRNGRGSPAHLVVLATMVASGRHPERGAKVLRRYRGSFPRATEFLDNWRAQFGDRDAGKDDPYAVALCSALHDGDEKPLIEHLLAGDVGTENILSGAEFLASRSAWTGVNRLRSALMKIGTRRTVELAVLAAILAGEAEECLTLLRDIEQSSGGSGLPLPLIHMRIRANEDLGRHQPVIADLQKIRQGDADLAVGRRLLDTYILIGAIPELRNEAERALAAGQLDPERALRVANVLRAHAPNVARRALTSAATEEIRPDLVGPTLSLAADLGDEETRSRMLSLFLAPEREGRGFHAFGSIEELRDFLASGNTTYSANFAKWTSGHVPAAAVMGGDGTTFARLFLAESAHRCNDIGETFPMLLRSGALRAPFGGLAGGLPVLRMDLSAVLLATRLGILTELDAAFSIEVPLSIQPALIEMENRLPNLGTERLAEWEAMLDPARSRLRLADAVPADAISIDDEDHPGAFSVEIVGRLLAQAFVAGRIDRDELDLITERIGPVPAVPGERISSAVATSRSAYALLEAGILDKVLLGAHLHLRTTEAERGRHDLENARASAALRAAITGLRSHISEQLLAGSWTSIALPRNGLPTDLHIETLPFRCLAEVLAAQSEASADAAYWVEDRAVAHGRHAGAIDVFDVLEHLRERRLIDDRRRRTLLRSLRSAGYLFHPVDLDEVQAKVFEAPESDGSLIETPPLQELRRWFALEAQALHFINPNVGMNEEGVAGGEMNHVLKVLGLARRMLERIWNDLAADVRTKRARSSWVWTNLRVDRVQGLPADATPETRRQMLAISIAHTLDLPLMSSLSQGGDIATTFEPFVDWFVAEHLDPLAKADPDAAESVVDVVVAVVGPIVGRTTDIPETDPETVRKFLALRVHRFLQLLPKRWRDRIEDRPGIRKLLDLESAMVLTIADEDQVPVAKLAVACAEAYAQRMESTSVLVEPDRRRGLRLGFWNDGATIKLDLTIGERTVRLEPSVAALLLPEPEARAAALARVDGLTDRLGSIGPDDLKRIARIELADARFEAFSALERNDFHSASGRIGASIRESGKLSLDDIELPSVEAVRSYLRRTAGGSADTWNRLAEEFGTMEAGRRAAGLPLDAPETFLGAYGASPDEPDDDVRRLDASTPLHALLRIQGAVASGGHANAIAAGTGTLLEAVSNLAKLFVALVRHGTATGLGREDWTSLEPSERLQLLWVYADRMTEVLSPPGIGMEPIADWIAGWTRFDLVDQAHMHRQPAWYDLLTHGLNPERFEALLAARALRILPVGEARDQLSAHFRTRLGYTSDQGWFPSLGIARPFSEAPAEVWPASDPLAVFIEAGWFPASHPFAERSDDAMANRLVAEAAGQPDPFIIPVLFSIIDVSKVTPATAGKMRELLDRIEAEAMLEPEVAGASHVLSARGSVAAALGDVDEFRTVLEKQARRAAAKWRDERLAAPLRSSTANAAYEGLVDSAYRHARSVAGDSGAVLRTFALHVAAIVRAWPNCRQAAISTLDAFIRGSSCEDARDAWPVLLKIRSE